jgi:glycosyltransferase involved in cell wall biosynthesis
MAKTVFIGMADALKGASGVGAVAGRNLAFLKRASGPEGCRAFLLGDADREVDASTRVYRSGLADPAPRRWLAVLSGWMGGITPAFRRGLASRLEAEKPDLVWIDMGAYASLIPLVRRHAPEAAIAVFCHNVERDYFATQAKPGPRGLKESFLAAVAARLERRAAREADLLILLHRPDAERFRELYGREGDGILPVSFDPPEAAPKSAGAGDGPFGAEPFFLFVGTLFPPNYEGVSWFVREVLPRVPGRLVVAGKGFERVATEFVSERCRVLGFVEDLADLYRRADFVVAPIFSGGGMKVKTAEALSYGKTVVGTPEALRGYEVTEGREAFIRKDADGFVEAIRSLYPEGGASPCGTGDGRLGYNRAARELFEQRHSTEAAWKGFAELYDKALGRKAGTA